MIVMKRLMRIVKNQATVTTVRDSEAKALIRKVGPRRKCALVGGIHGSEHFLARVGEAHRYAQQLAFSAFPRAF